MEALPTEPIQGGHLAKSGAQAMFAVGIVFPIIATVGVVARFTSHKMARRPYGWDDALLVGALLAHYVQLIGLFIGLFLGRFGWSVGEGITAKELAIDAEVVIWLQYPYAFAMGLVRAAICLWLLRIFIQRSFKICVYIILALNAAWFIYVIIVTSTQCIPFAYNWNKTIPDGHCINQTTTLLVNAVWGVVLDLMIWSLPIPRVWSLQMRSALKIALTAVFSLGVLDIVVSIVRVVTVTQINYADLGASVVPAFIWALCEPAIAVLVACLPACRPLLHHMLPESLRATMRSSKRAAASYGKLDEQSGVKLVDRSKSLQEQHQSQPAASRWREGRSESNEDLATMHSVGGTPPSTKTHAITTDESV